MGLRILRMYKYEVVLRMYTSLLLLARLVAAFFFLVLRKVHLFALACQDSGWLQKARKYCLEPCVWFS